MPDCSVYLLEAGMAAELPGIPPRMPAGPFPFWGTYALLDFAFSALRSLSPDPCWLVCETRDRQPLVQAASRWGRNAFRQRDAEEGLAELRRLAASERAPWVVVSSVCYAAFLEPEALGLLRGVGSGRRVRADGTLLPVYILSREAWGQSVEEAARQSAEAGGGLKGLIASYLPGKIREQLDVPGTVFFTDNLMQLWDAQHFLRENLGGGRAASYLQRIAGAQQPSAEARIGAAGDVSSSLIGPGAQVEGTVVDSVVFPGVLVRRGATLRGCVVMNGAKIGADARVSNTMILPNQELGGEAETVGAGAEIGDTRNVVHMRNDDHPRQISRGVTLIGMNASVPAGMEVGSGCYIGPGVGAGVLKSMKKLPRGASIR